MTTNQARLPGPRARCPFAITSAASLHPFVTEHVEPAATVITDAWRGYSGIS